MTANIQDIIVSHTPSQNDLLSAGLVLEGLVTTTNEDGTKNIAPMGPIIEPDFERLLLRPFRQSNTFANLMRTRTGVFHVTDDVLLIARAAIGKIDPLPPLIPVPNSDGSILAEACRWYAFRVGTVYGQSERCKMLAHVTQQGQIRDFFGFNRAKHAVVEAAILATRLHLLQPNDVLAEFRRLEPLVQKTGGEPEREAFRLLQEYVQRSLDASADKTRE